MKITKAREIDQICFQIRQADFPRGANRARIDQLFQGWPPYSPEEVAADNRAINVNFLEAPRLGHDARMQYYNAFLKPGKFFTLRTDYGRQDKRAEYGAIVSNAMNRIMKRSSTYMECFRSKFALNILHGIGPSAWRDQEHWCPEAQGIVDIGIPGRTLIQMTNLPFFYIYRSLTQPELVRMTQGPNVDPGWNMPMVDAALAWLAEQTPQLIGQNWADYWAPEKINESVKADGGFFVGDRVPTLDCFDFYYFDDTAKEQGWRRRIILDSWSTPMAEGQTWMQRRKVGKPWELDEFLYSSGDRVVAQKRQNIVAFNFADMSAVAPFQYHSVRGLGFLLYAVCHLQNRLRCAFHEASFENLLQMFRIKSMDDVQRALRLKIHGFSFIDDNLTPVPANDRFQPNVQFAELAIGELEKLIQQNASSFAANQNSANDRVEKTRFQVMAEVNAMTSMVSAGLNQAYHYQNFENMEVVRRFMRCNSRDPDVNEFRACCLKRKVPEKLLSYECWDVEPERVMGAGNKTLEMTIAQQLMEWRPMMNPSAQNAVLRDSILAVTDDPARADALVPDEPQISNSVHDTELAFGTLYSGSIVTPKPGLNAVEVAGTMLKLMDNKIQGIIQQGGLGTPADVTGLSMCAQYTSAFIQQLAQDENNKQMVNMMNQTLSKEMNEVKAFAQRQQEAQQAAAEAQAKGNGQLDPKDAAKIQATQITAQQKVQNMKESHALKTAQRQIQFEHQLVQDQAKTDLELQKLQEQTRIDLEAQEAQNRLKEQQGGSEE